MDSFPFARAELLMEAKDFLSGINISYREDMRGEHLCNMMRALTDPAKDLTEGNLRRWSYYPRNETREISQETMLAESLISKIIGYLPHYYLWINMWKTPNWYHPPRITIPFDAVSALLKTCRRSRAQVQLSYQQAFEHQDGSIQYCNFKTDAFYVVLGCDDS